MQKIFKPMGGTVEIEFVGKVVEVTSRAPKHDDWIVVFEVAPMTFSSITVSKAYGMAIHIGDTVFAKYTIKKA